MDKKGENVLEQELETDYSDWPLLNSGTYLYIPSTCCRSDKNLPRLYWGEVKDIIDPNLTTNYVVFLKDLKKVGKLPFRHYQIDSFTRARRTLRGNLILERIFLSPRDVKSSIEITKEDYQKISGYMKEFGII